jgi:hypothetical protein
VSRVTCANQFAVEVAPLSSPTWSSSAWAATRDRSSTTWASRRVSSTNVAAASAASMDHTDASTTPSAMPCIRAVAEATRWWGAAIVVMPHITPAATDNVSLRTPHLTGMWTL